MFYGDYETPDELLLDIEFDIVHDFSDLDLDWEDLKSSTLDVYNQTGRIGLAMKFYIEYVDVKPYLKKIEGISALYDHFKTEMERYSRNCWAKGSIKRAIQNNRNMERVENIFLKNNEVTNE